MIRMMGNDAEYASVLSSYFYVFALYFVAV